MSHNYLVSKWMGYYLWLGSDFGAGLISIMHHVDLEPYRFWASSIWSRKLFVFIMYKDGIPLTQNRLCCRTFSIFKSYDFCWFRYSIDDWWRVCWVHKTDPNGINIYRTIWHHITRNKITNFNKILCKHLSLIHIWRCRRRG